MVKSSELRLIGFRAETLCVDRISRFRVLC